MEKPKLLIADSNEDFASALEQALTPYYRVVCCADGKDALSILRSQQPQILVLDPTLPGLDGLSLLEAALREDLHPMVMIIARFLNSYIEETAARLGVGYLMSKPCDIAAAVDRIRDLSRRLSPETPDPREQVSQLLLSLGFSAKHDGFHYLPDAVCLMAREPGQPVTKILYPAVARIHACSPDNVERSIRSALDAAWARKNAGAWQTLFPFHTDRRPSNADFITKLALWLNMRGHEGIL